MTMKCFFCTRPLRQATVLLNGHPVGPDCARKHNLMGPSAKGKKTVQRVKKAPKPKQVVDKFTRDLFDDDAGSISAQAG